MKLIDFHLNLSDNTGIDWDLNISQNKNLKNICNSVQNNFKEIDYWNIVILDKEFLNIETDKNYFQNILSDKFVPSLLIDLSLNNEEIEERILYLNNNFLNFWIKINPFIQNIKEKDYPKILNVLKIFNTFKKWFILVHYSPWTRNIDKIDNFWVVKLISDNTNKNIIIAHWWWIEILKFYLWIYEGQENNSNIYLETSFSLPFWEWSSVEKDFAFVMKKIWSHKCIFWSDFPYCWVKESKDYLDIFLDKYWFTLKDKENIFYNNAHKILFTKH